ncbi:MAG TPA: hypothetical protein PLJ84_06025 [Bacteroidales bacterium]|nr:hypothetical protein [Bacteroidales bacterium]HPT02135.1 hypothetical protein [Bacteroidales bacterium]
MTDTTYILTQAAQTGGASHNDFIEGLKIAATLAAPFIASFLTYWFAIRGKLKDSDIARRNELNTVLSNLLIVWHYLTKIEDTCKLKYDDKIALPIPKDYISSLTLKSGTLNDKCFNELDDSILSLKKYDPISFYELEGIGRRLEFLRKNFILPLIKSKSTANFNRVVAEKYLKLMIDELEEYIETIAEGLSNETLSKALDKLQRHFEKNTEKIKDELLLEYYELIVAINPNNAPTYEQFVSEISKPEAQAELNKQFESIGNIDMDKLMEVVADNPNISMEEIVMEIDIREKNANNNDDNPL